MFDPKIGRWASIDPEGFDAGDPNLLRYCGNDPTNYVDPSGLQPEVGPQPRRYPDRDIFALSVLPQHALLPAFAAVAGKYYIHGYTAKQLFDLDIDKKYGTPVPPVKGAPPAGFTFPNPVQSQARVCGIPIVVSQKVRIAIAAFRVFPVLPKGQGGDSDVDSSVIFRMRFTYSSTTITVAGIKTECEGTSAIDIWGGPLRTGTLIENALRNYGANFVFTPRQGESAEAMRQRFAKEFSEGAMKLAPADNNKPVFK